MTYKNIFKKYNITLSDLKKITHKYKLTRDKSKIMKGNQNAKNNKGGHAPLGNKNSVVTGEYEKIYYDVLTEKECDLYDNYQVGNVDDLLLQEYSSEYKLLTIRELRMMKRIKDLEDVDREIVGKKNIENNTETEIEKSNNIDIIQKIENGLTRIVSEKRKSRENMIKLGFNKRQLDLKEKQIENQLW